jgi:hypothetical protein
MTPRTVAAMQPYLFPYLGYFQLIRHADVFVLGDDYPWVRAGWINRNRILDRGEAVLFTLSVVSAPATTAIAERRVTDQYPRERRALLGRLAHAYARCPYAGDVLPLVEQWLPASERSLMAILRSTLTGVCGYLGVTTPIRLSSEHPTTDFHGVDRATRLVRAFGGTRYLNPPGGRGLYRRADFADAGLELAFLDPDLPPYPQAAPHAAFVPALSILDVLMNVSPDRAREMVAMGTEAPAA